MSSCFLLLYCRDTESDIVADEHGSKSRHKQHKKEKKKHKDKHKHKGHREKEENGSHHHHKKRKRKHEPELNAGKQVDSEVVYIDDGGLTKQIRLDDNSLQVLYFLNIISDTLLFFVFPL
jgi:hypothetical protein